MAYEWVSFTSDYGLADAYVAVCRGVILRTAPGVRVLDITHLVPPQDIRRGGAVLAQSVGFLPESVHLAVVDPGVGTQRRGIAVQTPNGALVGPDNGLLIAAAEVLGGITGVHELTEPRHRLAQVSTTFHGRDIFAPATAALALGEPLSGFGPELDPAELVRLPEPAVSVRPGHLASDVLSIDYYGNLQLAATAVDLRDFAGELGDRVTVTDGTTEFTATLARTFADVPAGEAVIHIDSVGHIAVAVNTASVLARLGTAPTTITISRPA